LRINNDLLTAQFSIKHSPLSKSIVAELIVEGIDRGVLVGTFQDGN